MADIFISYSGEDKTNVKLIAQLLEQQGWSVWWDRQIPIGKQFDTVIEEELQKSNCVIIVWTHRSIASEWVKNEANEAAQLGKLVPILLENVPIPLAFKRTETAMLTGWQGEEDHPELSLLFNAVEVTIREQKAKKENGSSSTILKPESHKPTIWSTEKKIDKPGSVKTNIIIAVSGFIVSLFSIYYYLSLQEKLSDQVDQRIFYLILVVFGIAVSAVIFGLMNSYASLKGETLNKKIQLAGPIVGVVLTVFGGFYFSPQPVDTTVTVRVFDKNKNPVTAGDVKIYLPEYIRSQSIDKMGQALFTGIPQNVKGSRIRIDVSSPGYATLHVDTLLNQKGTLDIMLPLSDVVFISGQVKRANETPISDVEINVDGTRYVAYSISNGTYQLRLQEYTLGDEITITTMHGGFEDKTRSLKISSPEIKDIDFVLQPVDQ